MFCNETDLDFGDEDFLQNAFEVPSVLGKNEIKSIPPVVKVATVESQSHNLEGNSSLSKNNLHSALLQRTNYTDSNQDKLSDPFAFSKLKRVSSPQASLVNSEHKLPVNNCIVDKFNRIDNVSASKTSTAENRSKSSETPVSFEEQQSYYDGAFSDDFFQMDFEDEKIEEFCQDISRSSPESFKSFVNSNLNEDGLPIIENSVKIVGNLHPRNILDPKCNLLQKHKQFETNENSMGNLTICNKENDNLITMKDRVVKQSLDTLQMKQLSNTNQTDKLVSPENLSETKPNILKEFKVQKRKFPGPAGILPHLPQEATSHSLHAPLSEAVASKVSKCEELPCSQSSVEEFNKPPWKIMLKDLDSAGSDSNSLLACFNIQWVLQQAAAKQLPKGKVPILCVLIRNIIVKGADASVVLKDKTGEISATIHRKLLEEYNDYLEPGAALILKQVSVFSPKLHRHYLNLTPNNLVCVYDCNGDLFNSDASGSNLLTALKDLNSVKKLSESCCISNLSNIHLQRRIQQENINSTISSNMQQHTVKSTHNNLRTESFNAVRARGKSDGHLLPEVKPQFLFNSPDINKGRNLSYTENRDAFSSSKVNLHPQNVSLTMNGFHGRSFTPERPKELAKFKGVDGCGESNEDNETIETFCHTWKSGGVGEKISKANFAVPSASTSCDNMFSIMSDDQDLDLSHDDEFDRILQTVDDAVLFGF